MPKKTTAPEVAPTSAFKKALALRDALLIELLIVDTLMGVRNSGGRISVKRMTQVADRASAAAFKRATGKHGLTNVMKRAASLEKNAGTQQGTGKKAPATRPSR